jgi:hypothetical protein
MGRIESIMEFTEHQTNILAGIPPLVEDATWRPIAPEDQHRIECEHFHACGEDATWTTRQGSLCVCDYHRFTAEIQRIVEALAAQNPSTFFVRQSRERISA